jgi:hypothetical protein
MKPQHYMTEFTGPSAATKILILHNSNNQKPWPSLVLDIMVKVMV